MDETRDEADIKAVAAFGRLKVTRDGWGPVELLAWARGKDADETFLISVMLSRLCADPVAREAPVHGLLHRSYGLTGHAGPELVAATQRGLGLSDRRAAALIERLDEQTRAAEGLSGGEA